VHGESGQATVEWVALALLAALVLGAAAALAGREPDRGLGELVAKRIARGPGELASATAVASPPSASTSPPSAPASHPSAPAPSRSGVSAPPAPAPRRAGISPAIRGIGTVARYAWIFCLGYHRWRYEQEHPIVAIEGLPVGEALRIANDCLNPHDYLFEE
jgi:hypothetical protein